MLSPTAKARTPGAAGRASRSWMCSARPSRAAREWPPLPAPPGRRPGSGFTPSRHGGRARATASTGRLRPGDDALGWLAQTGRVPLGYLGDPEKTAATFPEIDGVRHAVAGDRARWLGRRHRSSCTVATRCASTPAVRRCSPRRSRRHSRPIRRCTTPWSAAGRALVGARRSLPWSRSAMELTRHRRGATRRRGRPHRPLQAPEGDHPAAGAIVRSPSGKADYRWARETAIAGAHLGD